jgi:LPS export ABC transporter protein LptC
MRSGDDGLRRGFARFTRVALLATVLAAVGVAACNDTSGTAPKTSDDNVLPDSAEQGLWGTEVVLTGNSVAKGRLLSDKMYTYEGGNRIELLGVNVTFFDSLGAEDGVMTAREGTYSKRLNRLEVRGDVVILRENGSQLETPKLVYDELRNQIFSDTTFVLNQPPRRQLSGIGFESDTQLTQFRILKNAKGAMPVTVENP